MTRFSSLSRWNRMNFQEDWRDEDDWREKITNSNDSTLEWSVLVRVETGKVVSTWTRAGGFRFIDERGITWEEYRPNTKATGEPAP